MGLWCVAWKDKDLLHLAAFTCCPAPAPPPPVQRCYSLRRDEWWGGGACVMNSDYLLYWLSLMNLHTLNHIFSCSHCEYVCLVCRIGHLQIHFTRYCLLFLDVDMKRVEKCLQWRLLVPQNNKQFHGKEIVSTVEQMQSWQLQISWVLTKVPALHK